MVNITLMDQWDITHDHGDIVGIYVVFWKKNISYIWENHWENNDDRDAIFFLIMNNAVFHLQNLGFSYLMGAQV